MPVFDYRCADCGNLSEHTTDGSVLIEDLCLECAKKTIMSKQPSAPLGFILKGQGFYKPS